ncbi:MAG: hypothetical protein IT566_06630 [Rhodospirillaceae bacterium]|nr:hypothetical protein [Rhodospirillaceae bacterium]
MGGADIHNLAFRFPVLLFSMPPVMPGADVRSFLIALLLFVPRAVFAGDAGLQRDMDALEDRWALTKYEMTDKAQRLQNVQALHLEAAGLAQRYPGRAEPMIWEALVYILEAEVHSSTASLSALRSARELLEAAGKIDGAALNGAVHANLGSLYYEVPGWPISFGSNGKAEAHLRQALAHDRDGREANYFYGDFLLQRKRPKEALPYLEKALGVPIDPAHARADKGRNKEARDAYDKAKAALSR